MSIFIFLSAYSQSWKVWYDSTLFYYDKEQFAKASESIQKCLNECHYCEDTTLLKIKSLQIDIYTDISDYQQVLKLFEQDSVFFEKHAYFQPYVGNIYHAIGLSYTHLNNVQKAILYMSKSSQLYEKYYTKKSKEYISNLCSIGSLYVEDNSKNAKIYYEQALELAREIIDHYPKSYAIACNCLGLMYLYSSDLRNAEYYLSESKRTYEKYQLTSSYDYAITCFNLGVLYSNKKENFLAEQNYTIALQNIELVLGKEHLYYATIANYLSSLYYNNGFFYTAEKMANEALKVYEKIYGRNSNAYINQANRLALIYARTGKLAQAENLYYENVAILEKENKINTDEYVQTVSYLIDLYTRLGNYNKAEYLIEKIEIPLKQSIYLHSSDTADYLAYLNRKGLLYMYRKEYQKAIPIYTQAIEISQKIYKNVFSEKDVIAFYFNIAGCYLALNQYQVTKIYHDTVAKIIQNIYQNHQENEYTAYLYLSMGNLAKQTKNYPRAESLYVKSMNIREKIHGKMSEEYLNVASNLCKLLLIENKHAQAIHLIKEIIKVQYQLTENIFSTSSEQEKEKYFENDIVDTYETLSRVVHVMWKKGKPHYTPYLYNFCIQMKGIILYSTATLKNKIEESQDTTIKKLCFQWNSLKNRYIAETQKSHNKQNKKTLDSLLYLINEYEKSISNKIGRSHALKYIDSLSWKDIQKQLKPKEAAVEIIRYTFNNTVYYLALIIAERSKYPQLVTIFEGIPYEEENGILMAYKRAIKSKIKDEYSYNLLWKPIMQKLNGIKKVYISSDGIYHQINLGTLLNTRTNTYVVDEIQIINLTNTKDLLQNYIQPNSAAYYLIGNPTFELQKDIDTQNQKPESEQILHNLSQLEGAEREVKEISTILPSAKICIGAEATEEYIKSIKNPRILHIATHGYFKKGQYQSSTQAMLNAGLLFAGAADYDKMNVRPLDKEDGKLTAFEVMNMELDSTELVVLSACETGIGQASKEGVYGLQRAFKVAGSQSIIMSLWKVNDEATQLLMTKFYENWQKKNMDKRKAFENAQKELRTQYQEPYYWGAFVMIE